jgi:hypothetical protein
MSVQEDVKDIQIELQSTLSTLQELEVGVGRLLEHDLIGGIVQMQMNLDGMKEWVQKKIKEAMDNRFHDIVEKSVVEEKPRTKTKQVLQDMTDRMNDVNTRLLCVEASVVKGKHAAARQAAIQDMTVRMNDVEKRLVSLEKGHGLVQQISAQACLAEMKDLYNTILHMINSKPDNMRLAMQLVEKLQEAGMSSEAGLQDVTVVKMNADDFDTASQEGVKESRS